MSFMEKISAIKKEITEKKGKEWDSLQNTTEKQLELLLYYLEHPSMLDNPKLREELIDLYYKAKETKFTKMEGINRKIDQLNIKLGKYEKSDEKESKKKIKFTNYVQAIKDLRRKVEFLLHSPLGTSLPAITQKSLIIFTNYLNHPDLSKKQKLFDDMHDKYLEAEVSEFMRMQAFNDMLSMLEIKLGALTQEMKTHKTLEEKEIEFEAKEIEFEKLEEEKKKLAEEWEKIKKEKENLEAEKISLKNEKENLLKEWEILNEEIKKLERMVKKT